MPRWRGILGAVLLVATVMGCGSLPDLEVFGNRTVHCGPFEGPDCNDLLEIGLDGVAGARSEEPAAIYVDHACPPNARCAASELGGETAAFVVRWADGTVQWATIPLPEDWPASPAGQAMEMLDPLPQHLSELLGS